MLKLAHVPDHERTPRAAGAGSAGVPRLQHLYYAFLSYSHKDQMMVDWLHRELERFRVPRVLAGQLTPNGVIPKRLTPIFRDRHELAAADDLGEEIREALAASRYLIVLCSPDAARSRWVNAEIETFKRTRPDGCVLAAIVGGDPFASDVAGRENEECFPPALREKYDRRGRPTGKRAEPLAADLRESGDGKRTGFLKLVAGMLEVGLDDLVQRDTTQRHRRLAYATAASIAGMAITSSLAVAALQARDAARDQRREAEGLVAFMVGDLKDKLEPIGRLDALDGVGSRVLAYYSKQDTSELTDAALIQRARALSLTAQVAYLRGDYDGASRLYREAMAGTGEAVSRDPEDAKRLFDHAQNVFWVGELARARGQTDRAITAYSEYKRLADRLVEIEPDNLKWRMEALYGVENLGISLYNKRRFPEAARQFESALRPMESLASVDLGNRTYQKELSTVFAWLADAQRAQGNLGAAVRLRERQISLLNGVIASGVTDVEFRQHLVPAHQALGILLMSQGQSRRGLDELRLAVDEADRLVPIEPDNKLWKGLAANAKLELAKALHSLGRNDEAARQTGAACSIVARLGAARPVSSRQTACLTLRSRLALESGANAVALALAQQALASAQAERSEDPVKDRHRVAAAFRLRGDVRQQMGDREQARIDWSSALASIPPGVPETTFEMDEHATILERLGRAAEAGRMVSKLNSKGYQRPAKLKGG